MPENCAVYEIMRKMPRRMTFACRITKATNWHSEYVILIDFPL